MSDSDDRVQGLVAMHSETMCFGTGETIAECTDCSRAQHINGKDALYTSDSG